MSLRFRPTAVGAVSLAVLVVTAGAAGGSPAPIAPPRPAWTGFAADAQHSGQTVASPQPLTSVHWQVTVDHKPSCCVDGPLAHYATPMITSANTVVVPVRIGPNRGFKLVGYAGADGTKKWTLPTDYTVPVGALTEWPPPIPATLVDDSTVAVAGAGGTILVRSHVDDAVGAVHRIAFYGIDQYRAHRAAYRRTVQITTPITTGPDGSLYFGYSAAAATPATCAAGSPGSPPPARAPTSRPASSPGAENATEIALNCAPALSPDGSPGYVTVVTTAGTGGWSGSTARP